METKGFSTDEIGDRLDIYFRRVTELNKLSTILLDNVEAIYRQGKSVVDSVIELDDNISAKIIGIKTSSDDTKKTFLQVEYTCSGSHEFVLHFNRTVEITQ